MVLFVPVPCTCARALTGAYGDYDGEEDSEHRAHSEAEQGVLKRRSSDCPHARSEGDEEEEVPRPRSGDSPTHRGP